MKIIKVPIEKLKLDENNSRKHSGKNITAIEKSIDAFGQQKPIVINHDHVVVAGNGTLQASLNLGLTHLNCVMTELDGDSEKAFAIADNKTALLATWDDDELTATFRELESNGFPLENLGFDKKELDEYLNASEKKIYEDVFVSEFLVLVTCQNETEQAEVFDKCQKMGYEAKLVS